MRFIIDAFNAPENQYDWSGSLKMIGQFFYIILVFAAIILMAYFATKWIAGARMGGKRGGAGNIKLIESYAVNMQASLQIIRVGRKYLLIGVTKDRFNYLTELSEDDLNISAQTAQVLPFENILKRYMPSIGGRNSKGHDISEEGADE